MTRLLALTVALSALFSTQVLAQQTMCDEGSMMKIQARLDKMNNNAIQKMARDKAMVEFEQAKAAMAKNDMAACEMHMKAADSDSMDQ